MRFGFFKKKASAAEEVDLPLVPAGPEPLGEDHFGELERALGYVFKDRSLLTRALTHRSVPGAAAAAGQHSDYEQLEFLGDAVLDLAVAHQLLEHYPGSSEGALSKMRAALVNTSSLAEIAKKVGVGPFIRLSRAELSSGGSERQSILADVFEALMGAIYREAGFELAKQVVSKLLGETIQSVTPHDPKTELQEALHASGSGAPQYLVEFVEGPEHSPTYVSIVKVDGQIVGRGKGRTKKESQQAAAAEALSLINGKDDLDVQETVQPEASESASSSVNNNAKNIAHGDAQGKEAS